MQKDRQHYELEIKRILKDIPVQVVDDKETKKAVFSLLYVGGLGVRFKRLVDDPQMKRRGTKQAVVELTALKRMAREIKTAMTNLANEAVLALPTASRLDQAQEALEVLVGDIDLAQQALSTGPLGQQLLAQAPMGRPRKAPQVHADHVAASAAKAYRRLTGKIPTMTKGPGENYKGQPVQVGKGPFVSMLAALFKLYEIDVQSVEHYARLAIAGEKSGK